MSTRTFIQGSIEYLDVVVTADVNLTGAVEFSLDRGTAWVTAVWIGSAGLVRTARYLLDTTAMDRGSSYPVWVRLADTPEVPVVSAGSIRIS